MRAISNWYKKVATDFLSIRISDKAVKITLHNMWAVYGGGGEGILGCPVYFGGYQCIIGGIS